ncbi:MAG: DUF1461 domain-containing protein [Chloroflexi bacterium]|nr:DUF1461 domain-containing protein [Chloroflexota bacterium]
MRILGLLLGGLAVLAVPLAIVLTNLRAVTFDRSLWLAGYERNGVPQTTGMSLAELGTATDQIMAYLETGWPVTLVIQKETGRAPLFNERETQHLADVRDIFLLMFRLQMGALAVLALFVALALGVRRRRGVGAVARAGAAGGVLTMAVLALLGGLAQGDFSSWWLQFHLLSFRNDLWQLDPRTDYMIRMYPQPFWYEMVVRLAVRSFAWAAGLTAACLAYLRWARRGLDLAALTGRRRVAES